MRKIVIGITARASYSRIKSTLFALRKREDVKLCVVLMCSAAKRDTFGNVPTQIEIDGIHADYVLDTLDDNDELISQIHTVTRTMGALSELLIKEKPDLVVAIADRYEVMSIAISASYLGIPLAHIQGGEITGSIDEKVRHAITKLADIHCVSNLQCYNNVLRMGERKNSIYITGCPSCDLARHVLKNEEDFRFDISQKYRWVGNFSTNPNGYIIVLQHAVSGEQKLLKQLTLMTLNAVTQTQYQIYWVCPNADIGGQVIRTTVKDYITAHSNVNIAVFDAIDSMDFLWLLIHSKGIVGNSSVAIRECSYLGVPAVDIGSRQSGREHCSNVIHSDYSVEDILSAINQLENIERISCDVYGDGKSGERVADVLATCELNVDKKLYFEDL